MAASFLFYDTETTGLSRSLDQILEFAAVRTDEALQEVERARIRIRLRPDVVPSPAALLVHRIRPADLAAGRSEYEAVREIHARLTRPGTRSLGYNSIGFDDEFLRFSFYRNLLPPYEHQYARGCRRLDLFPVALLYWVQESDLLAWPTPEGRVSFRLEDLGRENAVFEGRCHDALEDAAACLELARRLARNAELWSWALGAFDPDVDAARLKRLPVAFRSELGDHRLALLLSGEWGTQNGFLAPVLGIGFSEPYPKQSLWLRLDRPFPPPSEEEAGSAADPGVARKRLGEPGILLPPRERYLARLGGERRRLFAAHLEWLKAHPEEFAARVRRHRGWRHPPVPDLDPDAGLYQNGFLPRPDELLCRRFHEAGWPERLELAERFAGPQARTLAHRLILRNHPGPLPGALAREAEAHLRRIACGAPLRDHAGRPRRTPLAALAEIERLEGAPETDDASRELLAELRREILNRWGAYLPGAVRQAPLPLAGP